jgi:HAD superfamily hydrolase (TIGR01509 family)
MDIQLIIFDLDGVLVDSTELYNRLLHEMVMENSIEMPYENFVASINGLSLESCLASIEKQSGKVLPDNFAAEYEERAIDIFREKLRPIPGVFTALNSIKQPICVASGSSHRRIKLSLSLTGLLPKFADNIYSASDVLRGKPAPDLFLYAAKQMGHAPKHCAVVEDSVPGVKAGVAAGMTVFAYVKPETETTLVEAGAHFVFQDMHKLPDLLQTKLSVS